MPKHLLREFAPCSYTYLSPSVLFSGKVETYEDLFSCFLFSRFKDSRKDDIWLVDVSMSFFCSNEPPLPS